MRASPRPGRSRRRTGLTMLELLVVLVVVGTMLGVVLPRFTVTGRQAAQTVAFQIVQDLELVRTRALATRASTRICFQDGSTRAWGAFADHDRDGTIVETDAERAAAAAFGRRTLPAGVSFGRGAAPPAPNDIFGRPDISFVNHWIEFDARGLVAETGQTATIYLRSDRDPHAVSAVQLSPAGNVRLWTWRDNQWQ